MTLTFTTDTDPERFRARVSTFFRADPVSRTLPLTVLDAVITGVYDEWVLACVETAPGLVAACAVQTPPHNVIVAASSAEDARTLAHGLRAEGFAFPGVVGLRPYAEDFATAWCEGSTRTAVD